MGQILSEYDLEHLENHLLRRRVTKTDGISCVLYAGPYNISLTLKSREVVLFSLPNSSMCHGLLQSRVSNFCLRILQSFASKHIMSASLNKVCNNERKLLEELLDFTNSSAAINCDPIFMSTTKSQSCSTLYNNDLPPQYRIFLTSWQLLQERNLNLVYFYKLLKYFSMISKIFFRIICSDLETNLNHLH